jgi:hypothetical protein
MAGLGKGLSAALGLPGAGAAPSGPTVRVVRGNEIAVVPVGAH